MVHLVVEYTANITDEAAIPALLAKINQVLIEQGGVFPTGGIRSRAVELKDYRIADGKADDAFVHCTMKIGFGRPPDVKKRATDAVFETIKAHFAELFAKRYLALSMEVHEFDEAGTYKHNNIHTRFRKPA
jgi:5-carboxymethyl-2-hydroxymuconate isomerase